MSGGSWDYLYSRVEDAAERLLTDKRTTPLRRAFGKHLALVAKAMHDIEWVDSGDCGPGDEVPAIEASLGSNARALEIEAIVEDAKAVIETLQSLLRDAQKE